MILAFSGCQNKPTPTNQQVGLVKPKWLYSKQLDDKKLAIGYSEPVFGGIYAQRQNALIDARQKLAHKIKTILSSTHTNFIKVYGKKILVEDIKNIDEFSKILLKNTLQYDAYIDNKKNLYLLVGLADINIKLARKKTTTFNKERLLNSKCYDTNILNSINTKAPIYNSKPLWFYSQTSLEAMGIAPKLDNNFSQQKKRAELYAKANFIKKKQSYLASKNSLLQILKHNESVVLTKDISNYKSSGEIKPSRIEDIWIDTNSCELYLLIK